MKSNSGMRSRAGGGIGSAVVRNRPLGKTAKPTPNAMNVKAVSQIGQQIGNHATDHRGLLRGGVEQPSAGRGYMPPTGVKDNRLVGPGAGREVMKSGAQGVHGPVAGTPKPQGREILREFGPDSANARNRR